MSTRHTPGPWRVMDGQIVARNGEVIGTFENPADGLVMAAGPNLLAACKNGLRHYEIAADDGLGDLLASAIEKAEA